jgi:hypothetical protein
MVLRPQIRYGSKAKIDKKERPTRQYVCILQKLERQLSGLGWGFETASNLIHWTKIPSPFAFPIHRLTL